MDSNQIIQGNCLDVLSKLPADSVDVCITSPPYFGLRSNPCEPIIWGSKSGCKHVWGDKQPFAGQVAGNKKPSNGFQQHAKSASQSPQYAQKKPTAGQFCRVCGAWLGQLGLEPTPELYVEHLTAIFAQVRRVLKPTATLWLNLGSSYNKANCLEMIPALAAIALVKDGWLLKQEIIWAKPNPMPESCRGRCTRSHEFIFMFSKGQTLQRTIKFVDLPLEKCHLNKNFGLCLTESTRALIPVNYYQSALSKVAISLASFIFDFSQSQENFGLPPLYSQKWQKKSNGADSFFVRNLPYIHLPAAQASRFLCSQTTTKEFFTELQRLYVDATSRKKLRINGRKSAFSLFFCNSQTSFTINESGTIYKFDFAHAYIITEKTKKIKYYYDHEAIKEPCVDKESITGRRFRGRKAILTSGQLPNGPSGIHNTSKIEVGKVYLKRNKRDVWTITVKSVRGSGHFSAYPVDLVEPCILAGCPKSGVVLDCFMGSGTSAIAALKNGRRYLGIEASAKFVASAEKRIRKFRIEQSRNGKK